MEKEKHIIYCHCGGERIPDTIRRTVENKLENIKISRTVLKDLCGIAALRKDQISEIFNAHTDYMVIGCYQRTMELLFRQSGETANYPTNNIHINLIEDSVDEAAEKISAFCSKNQGSASTIQLTGDSGWPSWYPIIDYDRCTRCGQCSDFCLFGVFERTDDHIKVINPRGCKNHCPACARICPSTAIIFPKYAHGGAIGGSDEIDEKAEQQRQANDIEKILGDDLYGALERRRARRKSIIREEIMLKAMAERDKALGITTKN